MTALTGKMFRVLHKNTEYTAVAEINGRWIDGVTGHDVTKGKFLGEYLGVKYCSDNSRIEYFRNNGEVYQLWPDNRYLWLCNSTVEWAFEHSWKN